MNAGYHHPPAMSQQVPMANAAASGYSSNLPPMHYGQHHPPPSQLTHGSHLPPPHQPPSQPQPHHQHHQHQHQPQLPPPPLQHHHAQQQPPPPHQPQLQSSHHLQHHPLHQQPHPAQHQLPNPLQQQQRPPAMSETSSPPVLPPTSDAGSMVSFSKIDEATNRKYQLDVVQQPRRARMCGFGDKDRRPITPPPCVRLIITDMTTGKEVDCNEIDHSMFVLTVDLWNEAGSQEVNLVRSSAGTPSISSTTTYSYSALNNASFNGSNDSNPAQYHPPSASSRHSEYAQSSGVPYVQDYAAPPQGYAPVPSSYSQNGSYGPPQQYYPPHTYRPDVGAPVASQATMGQFRNGSQPGYAQDQNAITRMAVVGGQPQGMFTRNLIGSLAASAFRLSDTDDRIGIWFVLQDLSVRTEGPFRLRFSFVNVGLPTAANRDGPRVNQGKVMILASTFSDVFSVYSAKKFPGVCESTPLSKTFASQGIKIPIRKDSNVKGEGGDDEDY
ncbi:velvet factor-domain-containing protein [Thelonectria olida]|uniref:Velvet factor-domain-containing protein n=1 Tax=Thelonectria olida TaxID=1576542 RepID=A0A9P8WDN4_9HYPO|nr:velvet factor-domain-containing protein [Thelonectria olida]